MAYPGSKLLIVSNTAGTTSDVGGREAELLEKNTGVAVLRHDTKVRLDGSTSACLPVSTSDNYLLQKPGCHKEVLNYFRNQQDSGVTRPSQIAVVGDRLLTDMMLANDMGAHGLWTRHGVPGVTPGLVGFLADGKLRPNLSQFSKLELRLADLLTRRGYAPPSPLSEFE